MDRAENRGTLADRALTSVVGWMIRILGKTLRFRREGHVALAETIASGSPVIIFGWHEYLLIGCCDLAHYGPTIMISQSNDGDRVTRIAESLGWRVVRGSSSRGGARALLQLVRLLEHGAFVGHLVDGPRGPRREVKPGLLLMAQRSGATLFPTVYAAKWAWRPRSWDRQLRCRPATSPPVTTAALRAGGPTRRLPGPPRDRARLPGRRSSSQPPVGRRACPAEAGA